MQQNKKNVRNKANNISFIKVFIFIIKYADQKNNYVKGEVWDLRP